MSLATFDPFSAEVMADPYGWYRTLRDESPCHFVPARNLYVISRYEDVVAAARNHVAFSSTGGVGLDWEQRPMMPMYDPPQHTRLRRLVARHFTPAALAPLEAVVERRATELLRPLLEGGSVELVSEVAVPLSLGVIADLYGMPEERRGDLRRWSQGTVEELVGGLDADTRARLDPLRKEFVVFLRETIAARRAQPRLEAGDVLSMLLAASDEDKLTDKEVVAFGVLVLVAGFETTVNAIANGVLAFVDNPEQWDRLAADEALLAPALEEVVRYDGPVHSFFRNTIADATIAGTSIPKGVKVQLLFASANRDERRFEAPDAFRIQRSVGDHIAYGAGIHYCLGAQLARLQLRSVFRVLARSVARLAIAGPVERSQSVLFRGVKTLPLRAEIRT